MQFSPRILIALVLVVSCTVACADPEEAKREYLANGDRLAAAGKYSEAAIEYRNALAQDGKFGEARKKLAIAYEKSNRPEQAYAEYVRAADLLPNDMAVQLTAARFLFLARQFSDAQYRVQLVLEREPKNVEALILRGNVLAGLRDMPGAMEDIEAAIQIDPAHGLHHTNMGLLRLAQGQVTPARLAFEKAVEVDPKSVQARVALANFYWAIGEMPLAEESLRAALALEPENLLLNRVAAAFYMSANKLGELEPHLKLLADRSKSFQPRLTLADFYLMSKRTDEAKAMLRAMGSQGAAGVRARTRLAQIDYSEGRRAEAHAAIDRILARQANQAAPLRARAEWLRDENKLPQALENARAAVAIEPRSISGLYLLGSVQVASRQVDDAIKTFNDILRLNPSATAASLQLGQLYLAKGQAVTAVTMAQQIARSAPGLVEGQELLGRSLLRMGDYTAAAGQANLLLAKVPERPQAHVILAELALLRGRNAEARQHFMKAYSLAPASFDALSGLTTLDLLEQNAARARSRVEARLAAEPTNVSVLTLAARVYAAAKDPAKAEATLRTILGKEPDNARAYALLAQLFLAQNRIVDARREYEGMARRNPRDIAAFTLVGVLYEAENNIPAAVDQYEQTLRQEPNAAVAANNLAFLYSRDQVKLEEAMRLAQVAARGLPDNPEVQDTLGWIYYRQNKPEQAISAFEFAVGRDPEHAIYRYHLALALVQGDQPEKARAQVESALKLRPDFGEARSLLQSLPRPLSKG